MNDFHIDKAERIVKDFERKQRNKILNLMRSAEEENNIKKLSELLKEYNLWTR